MALRCSRSASRDSGHAAELGVKRDTTAIDAGRSAWWARWWRQRYGMVPLAVLLIGLLASAATIMQLWRVVQAKDQERFTHAVAQAQDAIDDRLETYIALLRAGAGLFAANEMQVSRDAFHAFAERLQLRTRYPGIQSIGYSARLLPAERDKLVTAIRSEDARAEEANAFRIWPEQPARPEYHTILYLEPLDRRNRAALGYDMFSEPTRRAAMERARDTGQPVASGKVQLVQEIDAQKQAGFLIYMPVYRDIGIPDDEAERRRRLAGFVYSSFRADDLLGEILPDTAKPRLCLAVYDGAPAEANLLHQSCGRQNTSPERDAFRFTVARTLAVAGRSWTIVYATGPGFEPGSSRQLVPFVFGGEVLATFLIAGATLLQARARRAAECANTKTRQHARELELLHRTGREIAAELDLGCLVQHVTDAGTELTGAQFGAFAAKVAQDSERYTVQALSGIPREDAVHLLLPDDVVISGPMPCGRDVVRSDDITKDPHFGSGTLPLGMPAGHRPVRSYLAVPVMSRSGEVLGRLCFGHERPGIFTDHSESIVRGMAAQAAIAIDNARLFQAANAEIAQRRRAEAQQRLLLAELNHRVKNILTVIQSVARLTGTTAVSLDDFLEIFTGRLQALAVANELLTGTGWQATSLSALLQRALLPHGAQDEERLVLRVEEVRVPAALTQHLTLAVHELATNAAKHGALSVPEGRIVIEAGPIVDSEPTALRLVWRELGGPPVQPPPRQGFGTQLLRQLTAHEQHGRLDLDWRREGLVCTLEFPLAVA
jgi:CHASE1-domain containing sensor protein/two-component sensor histidine kinase